MHGCRQRKHPDFPESRFTLQWKEQTVAWHDSHFFKQRLQRRLAQWSQLFWKHLEHSSFEQSPHFLRQLTHDKCPDEHKNNSCVCSWHNSHDILGVSSWAIGSNWKSNCLAESLLFNVMANLNIGAFIIVVLRSFVEIFKECL